jgi:hypothetical protein
MGENRYEEGVMRMNRHFVIMLAFIVTACLVPACGGNGNGGGDADAAEDVLIPDMDAPDGPEAVEPGPLVLVSIRAVAVTTTSAVLSWYTFGPADSQADYGTDDTYGQATPLDAEMVTSHRVPLSGLQPDTEYHYRVRSSNAEGESAESSDHLFRTLAEDCATGSAFYVDAASAGGDGTSWASAWTSPEDIDWTAVGPGACITFREGSYADSLRVQGSGAPDPHRDPSGRTRVPHEQRGRGGGTARHRDPGLRDHEPGPGPRGARP